MGFGYTCHAIVSYDRYLLLVLDSTGGGLIQINYQTGCWETLYKCQLSTKYIASDISPPTALFDGSTSRHHSLSQTSYASAFDLFSDPFNNRFYKGLAVINDIAYFGISHKTKRSTRLSRSENSELAAFHLKQRKLLWRKQLKATGSGMLNVVAAPQISEESTYKAMVTKDYVDLSVKPVQPALLKSVNNKAVLTAVQKLEKQCMLGLSIKPVQPALLKSVNNKAVLKAVQRLENQGFKVAEVVIWATGLPHMNLDLKNFAKQPRTTTGAARSRLLATPVPHTAPDNYPPRSPPPPSMILAVRVQVA
eukprot:gene26235-17333_t